MADGQAEDPEISIERMGVKDLPQVRRIEKQSFPVPWPPNSYRREIRDNERAWYLVARLANRRLRPNRPQRRFPFNLWPRGLDGCDDVVAFAGMWFMLDEVHITTIAVTPFYRGIGIGEALIIEMSKLSQARGSERLTLEVRVSNSVAQNLYRKYGFTEHGVRPRYYSDDLEDALIMWSGPITGQEFCKRLSDNERDLSKRLCWSAHI